MNLLLVQNEVRRKFEVSAHVCPIKCIADGVLSFRRATGYSEATTFIMHIKVPEVAVKI